MKTIIFCVLILSYSAIAHAADKWTNLNVALVSTMWVVRLTDMRQTMYVYDHPEKYVENGPVVRHIGEKGVIPWFIGTAAVVHYIAHRLPNRWRTPFLVGANIGSLIPVIHNRRLGIKIPF